MKRYLTRRELEVARGIVAGKSRPAIAAELGISPKTFDTHRAHVMEKLGVVNAVQLLRYAVTGNGVVAACGNDVSLLEAPWWAP